MGQDRGTDPNFPPNLSILPSARNHFKAASPSAETDSEEDDPEQDIGTYGIAGRTWEAAYLLRQYLTPSSSNDIEFDPPCPLHDSPRQSTPRKRTILEVGSGTGFLSLALAPHLRSSDTLILTDLENVCPLLEKNLSEARQRWRRKKNETTDEATCLVKPLPWGDSSFLETSIKRPGLVPDYILASDLVYFPFLYPPLLQTLLGLTEYRASDDPRRESKKGPTLIFSYKIRSLVREQPFWEAFGRWFEFEAVQAGKVEEETKEEAIEGGGTEVTPDKAKRKRIWTRFGAAHESGSGKEDDSDELYIFIAHRRRSTLGISDVLEKGQATNEDLMLGRNGLEGELSGSGQFEEMLLAALEWD
ncbi:uncharacterized protein JCM6883_003974 [Sporobolomyces salmoneus]|uniref:uncharacterized protein n=1 Tax=Sporobolomyces salmoneus TaxID=183962 RepID=UPI003182A7A9